MRICKTRNRISKSHQRCDQAKLVESTHQIQELVVFKLALLFRFFFGAQRARINAAKINTTLIQAQAQAAKSGLQTQYLTQYNEYLKQKEGLDYYETNGLKQADQIIRISQISYKLGEIGYMEYIQNLTMAFDTKLKYLEALNLYNQAIIELNYINQGK